MQSRAPRVVRWHALELAPVQAGAAQQATVELENIGSATWRTRGHEEGLFLSYHWLDERGDPIVWDGPRTPLPAAIEPGERTGIPLHVRGPIPPGSYRFAVHLVEEHPSWLPRGGWCRGAARPRRRRSARGGPRLRRRRRHQCGGQQGHRGALPGRQP